MMNSHKAENIRFIFALPLIFQDLAHDGFRINGCGINAEKVGHEEGNKRNTSRKGFLARWRIFSNKQELTSSNE